MKRTRQNMETKLEEKVDYLEQRLNNLSKYEGNGLHETIKTIIESLAGILEKYNDLENELKLTDDNVEEIVSDTNKLKEDVKRIYDDIYPQRVNINNENKSQSQNQSEGEGENN